MSLPQLLLAALAALITLATIKRYAHPGRTILRRLLPGPLSASIVAGNLGQIFSAQGMAWHERFLKEYGRMFRVHGLFGDVQIFTSDTAAISAILNDTDTFHHTEEYNAIAQLIFGPGILGATGQQHKRLRRMLNPIFSSTNIRALTGAFFSIAYKLRDRIDAQIPPPSSSSESTTINMLEPLSLAALDLIGIGGAGYDFGALDGAENAYTNAAKSLLPTLTALTPLVPLLPHLVRLGSARLRRLLARLVPWPAAQRFRHIVDVMDKTAWEVYQEKKRKVLAKDSTEQDAAGGKDVISLAIQANETASPETRLTDAELAAQMGGLIFAGQDTTTGALCRTLEALSTRPELQARLRAEIREAKRAAGGEELGYEALWALPVLNAVCHETLRLYPPVTWFDRSAHADTTLPLSAPLHTPSGRQITSVPVCKGTTVVVSVQGVNRDTEIWGEDAGEFRVERWLGIRGGEGGEGGKDGEKEGKERKDGGEEGNGRGRGKWEEDKERYTKRLSVPSVWGAVLSFGAGPRACIGFRYALLELKVVLAVLLESFEFRPAAGEEVEWCLSFTMAPRVRRTGALGIPFIVRRAGDRVARG